MNTELVQPVRLKGTNLYCDARAQEIDGTKSSHDLSLHCSIRNSPGLRTSVLRAQKFYFFFRHFTFIIISFYRHISLT